TLVVGGWFAWKHFGDDDGNGSDALTPCPVASHPPAPAELKAVTLQVLNGTRRAGLAHRVADQFRQRGATVTKVGNAEKRAKATLVRHAPTATAVALAVREQLAAPARLATAAGSPVMLVIGPDFKGLAGTSAAGAAHRKD